MKSSAVARPYRPDARLVACGKLEVKRAAKTTAAASNKPSMTCAVARERRYEVRLPGSYDGFNTNSGPTSSAVWNALIRWRIVNAIAYAPNSVCVEYRAINHKARNRVIELDACDARAKRLLRNIGICRIRG